MRWRKRAVWRTVDRLLSNARVVVWDLFAPWAREVVDQRKASDGLDRFRRRSCG
jgi:hypothetical protein